MSKVKIGKAYSNVFDMLREEFPDNPEYAAGARKAYENAKIGNLLFILRSRLGLTQKDVADRMGVTQSAIAKMEDRGELLRFSDFIAYTTALNHNILLQVMDGKLTMMRVLRWHLEHVATIMKELEKLAADDPDIQDGVHRGFVEEMGKMLGEILPRWSGTMAPLTISQESTTAMYSDPIHIEIEAKESAIA